MWKEYVSQSQQIKYNIKLEEKEIVREERTWEVEKLTARQLGALETKNKLFNAALTLFSKHGFDKTTIDDITSAAGFSKGTFYNHFPSKEYVIVEYFNHIDDFYDATFAAAPPDLTAVEQFMLLADTMAQYCAHHYGLETLSVMYAYELSKQEKEPFLGNRDRSLFQQLRRILELGKETGEFDPQLDVEKMLDMVEKNFHGIIYDWCMYKGSFDLIKETNFHFRHVVKMLLP